MPCTVLSAYTFVNIRYSYAEQYASDALLRSTARSKQLIQRQIAPSNAKDLPLVSDPTYADDPQVGW